MQENNQNKKQLYTCILSQLCFKRRPREEHTVSSYCNGKMSRYVLELFDYLHLCSCISLLLLWALKGSRMSGKKQDYVAQCESWPDVPQQCTAGEGSVKGLDFCTHFRKDWLHHAYWTQHRKKESHIRIGGWGCFFFLSKPLNHSWELFCCLACMPQEFSTE